MTDTYNQTAIALAKDDKWDIIFDGTKFSIGYGTLSGGTYDPASIQWVTSTNVSTAIPRGYNWSKVNSFDTQFIGVSTGNYTPDTPLTFQSVYDNENKLLASHFTKNASRLMTDWTSNDVDVSTRWPIALDSTPPVDDTYMAVKLPIKPSTDPLVTGTIATTIDATNINLFINIITPGPHFANYYCAVSNTANLGTLFCKTYCSANTAICGPVLQQDCATGTKVTEPICQSYCKESAGGNCDEMLEKFCSDVLKDFYNDDVNGLLSGQYGNMCACFLPQTTMQGYISSLQQNFGTNVTPSAIKCFFPPCTGNSKAILPYAYKINCGNCPDESSCITSVNINVDGKFITPPIVDQSKECQAYNKKPDASFPPNTNVTLLKVPNECTSKGLPINVSTKKKYMTNYAVAGIIGIAILGFVVSCTFGHLKHRKKKK